MPVDQVLKKRISEILKNPTLFPDEFKSWISGHVQRDPNIIWELSQIPALPYSKMSGYPPLTTAVVACSASLTLTTADQDVAGCSVSLPAGTYVVWGNFDFFHSVNGGGLAVGTLDVGGSAQAAQALLLNTGAANGDRATVPQHWVITLAATTTIKLRAKKTINAGTVQAVLTHTTLSYLRTT